VSRVRECETTSGKSKKERRKQKRRKGKMKRKGKEDQRKKNDRKGHQCPSP
jgi:hypothetical protein